MDVLSEIKYWFYLFTCLVIQNIYLNINLYKNLNIVLYTIEIPCYNKRMHIRDVNYVPFCLP
jgi:hypothetical protein